MSNTPILLPFRFFNFDRKNKFLKIVQQKGFEVMSENQTVLSAKTKWWMSQWIIDTNSYSTSSYTENVVAYDIGIKKILDDEDKKYIDLLFEYINWKWVDFPWWKSVLFVYFLWYCVSLYCVNVLGIKDWILMYILIALFFSSWIIYYKHFSKKARKKEQLLNQQYRDKLKSYLQGINF